MPWREEEGEDLLNDGALEILGRSRMGRDGGVSIEDEHQRM